MNRSFNVRLLVAFVAVSFLVVGTVYAVNQKCVNGQQTVITTETLVSLPSGYVTPNGTSMPSGSTLETTATTTTIVTDASCFEVEYASTCTRANNAREKRESHHVARYPNGNVAQEWDAPPITSSDTKKVCQ